MNHSATPQVPMVWRKSTRSMNNGNCVEAGAWRKSSRSQNDGACVEARSQLSHIAARDSKHPTGGVLLMDAEEWQGFLAALR